MENIEITYLDEAEWEADEVSFCCGCVACVVCLCADVTDEVE